jgi:hypothetical protein
MEKTAGREAQQTDIAHLAEPVKVVNDAKAIVQGNGGSAK